MPTVSTEQRKYNVDAKLIPKGYQQIGTLTSAIGLKAPQGARVALIQAFTQNVRWTDDGTTPTAAIGMVLEAGKDMLYVGDLVAIQFIEVTASAELNVSYYF